MPERVASLPMYDLPEVRAATDAWWQGLARHFRRAGIANVPRTLTRRGEGAEFWLRRDLLFSQTCGYPLVTALSDRVTPVGTPEYDFDGCEGPRYRSFVLVGAGASWTSLAALRGRRLAINAPDSWSGHHALRRLCAPLASQGRFFADIVVSGSHRASIAMVARREADVAAIDAVTFGLLSRYAASLLEGIRILAQTPAAPGLPYIAGPTLARGEWARMRAALDCAFADRSLDDVRQALGIVAIAPLPLDEYRWLASPAA